MHNGVKMKFLLLSGGSGGHLIPALALAETLEPSGRCQLISTRRPVDRLLSDGGQPNVEWSTVPLQPFTPLWRWASPGYVANQLSAIRQVWAMVRRTRPDVVVGFGGYLSAVGVLAARANGIPAVIHEQNFLPGRANRLLARCADAVAVSFPETQRHLRPREAVQVTGNPTHFRPGAISFADARSSFGFDAERPVLLIAGGSQGSHTVNRLAMEMWEQWPAGERQRVQVIHLAGPAGAATVQRGYERLGVRAAVFPFLRRMETALTAATLAISRAGATTLSELLSFALPSVLIPYPHAGAHQRANARWLQTAGGAVVLEEEALTGERLGAEVRRMLASPARLEGMRQALRARSDGSAAEKLAELVRRVARRAFVRAEQVEARTRADAQGVHPSTGSG